MYWMHDASRFINNLGSLEHLYLGSVYICGLDRGFSEPESHERRKEKKRTEDLGGFSETRDLPL